MFGKIRQQIKRLTGARKFAAGALAIYIVGWLSERALTLLWEKALERQVPEALASVSNLLANDLVIGMALMAAFLLFVPPVTQLIFDLSVRAAAYVDFVGKRMSRREYLARIATEAIQLAVEARNVATFGRWDYSHYLDRDPNLSSEQRSMKENKRDAERHAEQSLKMQHFVTHNMGRAHFLMAEFVQFGFATNTPFAFQHITNLFCLEEVATALEAAAHKALSELERDGFDVAKYQDAPHQSPTGTEEKKMQ